MPGDKKGRGQTVAQKRDAMNSPARAVWRDRWLWLAALAVVPVLFQMRGAPLGVPVADDFDYLHRVALSGVHTLLDGCGSIFYWRPLSRQIYFEALWRLILDAPAVVAVLHALVLAATTVLLYRAFRVRWSGFVAWSAATFPLFAEATRMLVTWPSNFQDLGAMLFAALALHEAARNRLVTTLVALLLSLFCKEVGVLVALLVPWMPVRATRGHRIRWAAWTAGVVASWGLAYLAVSRLAGLQVPTRLDPNPAVAATPLLERLWWAIEHSFRSAFSLLGAGGAVEERMLWLGLAVLIAIACGIFYFRRGSRPALIENVPWIGWGLLWFVLASATLLAIFPTWAAYRGIFATIGLGVAFAAFFGAASRVLLGLLVAGRIVLLLMSPVAPAAISSTAFESGAAIDFPNLVRIQRLMVETRELLEGEFPVLPAGAVVVQHNLPRMSEWAFVGDKALQCWYRDTTVRWVRFETFRADTSLPAATVVEFQPGRPRQVALVDPRAMRLLLAAEQPILTGDWATALDRLERAEREQHDPAAEVFLATVIGKQATAHAGLGHVARARAEAGRAMTLWPENPDSRYILAYLLEQDGYYAAAAAQLDTMLLTYPDDPHARRARERLETLMQAQAP